MQNREYSIAHSDSVTVKWLSIRRSRNLIKIEVQTISVEKTNFLEQKLVNKI